MARLARPGRSFFYGWLIVVVSFVVILIGAGTRSAPGALLLDIEADTGWTKAQISMAAAAGILLLGLGGPVSGLLIDRFGIRRLTAAALTLTAAGMALSALSAEVWHLVLLFGLVSGFGAGLVASALGPVVANRWFTKGRGLVIGLFGAAASAGQLIFFPVLTSIAVADGWRVAVVALGAIILVVAMPAVLLLRESPADVGQRARGEDPASPPAPVVRADPGIMRRAVRTPEFWLLAGTFFVCGATSNGVVGTHFIAHAVDHGFTATVAAEALALMGAFNFIGTIASGWLTDRVDPRRLLLVYYGFRGISLLWLPAIHNQLDVVAFSVLFGLDYIATVPPTVMLTAEVFGRRNVGIVYGWIYAAHMLGAAILAAVAGVIRDTAGNYAIAYIAAGWMAIGAGVVALGLRRVRPNPMPPAVAAAG
ncbi:MAG TPA: MFS transporter [Candidatus Limnocylindrales bacterium]|jgi:sugar phosphate permease